MKAKNNKKNNLLIVVLILICLIALTCVAIKLKKGNEAEISYFDNLTKEEKSAIRGNNVNTENVIIDDNGNKINISPKLKDTYKLSENITIDNIYLTCKDRKTVLVANLNNLSENVTSSFNLQIKYLDENGATLHTENVNVKGIASKSITVLENVVDEDISNAYEIEFKII